MAPGGQQAPPQEEGELEPAVPLPPPPPLEPLLDVGPPVVVAVSEYTARIEWAQAGLRVPPCDDQEQQEVQAAAAYTVRHELQMQEIPIDAHAAGALLVGAQLLEAARSSVGEAAWRTVLEAPCCSAEVRVH